MFSTDLQSSSVIAVAIVFGTIHICAESLSLQSPFIESCNSIARCFRRVDDDDSKQVCRMMDEIRTQHFKSAKSALLLVATMLAVVFLVNYFIAEPRERPEALQMVVVSLSIYALTMLEVHLKFPWTPARTRVSIAVMNSIVLLDWGLAQAPEVWLVQHSLCFVWVIMMGLMEMDYRRSAFWSVAFCFLHTWKHLQMTESWASEHKTKAIVCYMLEALVAWTICFLSQVWFTERCFRCHDLEASKTMLSHILSVFCDAEVYIGPDFQIVGSHERFSKILTGGKPVQGTRFTNFLGGTDQERFKMFIESAAESASNQSKSLPSALHVHMHDHAGHTFAARIFHSAFLISDEYPHHLLGVCLDIPDPCAEAALDVATESAEAPAIDSGQAGLHREDLKAVDMTHNEDDSAAVSSSSLTHQTDLKEVIISIDPFQAGFPIRECSFSFCRKHEAADSSLLPKISDWLKAHDFKRFSRWASECVNNCAYRGVSGSKLKRFRMRLWGADLHIDTVDCFVDSDDSLQPSSHSSFASHEQIQDDAQTSTDGVELPTILQVRLNGIAGHNNLFRMILEALPRSSDRSYDSSDHAPKTQKSRSSDHSHGSSVHLPKVQKSRSSEHP